MKRQLFATDEILIARHELEVGMTLNPHSHDDFDQLVLITQGLCHYHVAGVPNEMKPGSFLLVPRGAKHFVEPLEGPCINIDFFVPPRADLMQLLELDEILGATG